MNIGIFSDTYFPQLNGVATSIQTLSRALEKKGHRVYIFTPYDPHAVKQDPPNIFRLPSLSCPFLQSYRASYAIPPQLLKQIHDLHLDIVHTQTEFTLGFLGKMVSIAHGVPMVHTYHTMYENYVHYIGGGHIITPETARKLSRIFCNRAKRVIAPTAKTEQLLLEYGVNKPISIIPTGIDTSFFAGSNYGEKELLALRASLGLKEDTPVILSVGRIAKEKSFDVIISALPELVKKLPDVMLVIVGEGIETENLEAFAESLGVKEHVLFTGGVPREEIGKYYHMGDVYCSASVSETQGLTFAEAMASGIPVTAKKDDCIENLLTHEKSGLIFEKNEDLPQFLYRALTDRPFMQKLTEQARKDIENLSVEAFADAVEQLYLEAIGAFSPDQKRSFYISGIRPLHRNHEGHPLNSEGVLCTIKKLPATLYRAIKK